MKRQFGKKLQLGRETLRSLHPDELPPAGGLLLPTTPIGTCPTPGGGGGTDTCFPCSCTT